LMGNRADTKVLWNENDKCITEATFEIGDYNLQSFFTSEDLDYDTTTVIRREISPGGKSRAFINDTPVTLDVMKKLGNMLMDIHSQHETLQLGNQAFQLKLIDAFAGNKELLNGYTDVWRQYQASKKEYEALVRDADSLRQESDYINFQLNELLAANLEEGEQEKIESEVKIMEHAEEIKSRFHTILQLLSDSEFNSRNSIGEAKVNLQHLTTFAPHYETLFQRLESVRIELDDIISEIEKEEERVEFDPTRAEVIKERLNLIYRLLKKHRVNQLTELLAIQEELQHKSQLTTNLDESIAKSKATFQEAEKELNTQAAKLTSTRKKAFDSLCKEITFLLKELGIADAVLKIEHQEIAPSNTGADAIEIVFSANKGITPRPLAQVASGGEFSRLMFCIKYVMATKTSMPTLILDEIDNGISGEVAIKLGNLMKVMAKRHQLITISHLPQIAAKADVHYFVYKDNTSSKTISNIKALTETERVEEIAKMIGGDSPSKVAMENAKELLASH
jgi:DNA repair protein RecN (Recombination protein N)